MSEDPKPHKAKTNGDKTSAVRFETSQIRGSIPKELYDRALETAASMGLTKTQTLINALNLFVAQNAQTRKDFLEEKAEELGMSKQKLKEQILESYKQEAKSKRANLE